MKLRYFAWIRERVGLQEEQVMGPRASIATLLEELATRSGKYDLFSSAEKMCIAINGSIIEPSRYSTHAIHDIDEVSIFPPVSGG